uniref:Uncharacterized protein n=3 Tax=viral metagenome TaxID=1070528 RepID=A0A6H1ZWY7_9ZZZZ
MAIKIRPVTDIAEKFVRVTPGRASEFIAGVEDVPDAEFESKAIAGEANYKVATTAAIAAGRRAKKLVGSGRRWKSRLQKLGESRYGTGTAEAVEAYAEGFSPYRDTIAGLTLPPKGARGDPKNIERVRVIADALHKKKLAG